MHHLMIDIEGMGTKPNAPVVSIGAVFFEPNSGDLGPEFYQVIDLESAMSAGAVPDGDTILWWLKQSPEARAAITTSDRVSVNTALLGLSAFIKDNTDAGRVQIWSNGANFDGVILRASYERIDIPCPWKFWNELDVRTIVAMGRAVGFDPKRDMPFDGDQHNALADARHQAKYVSAIWQRIVKPEIV